MVLSRRAVEEQARLMLDWRKAELDRLDRIHDYMRGEQKFQWLPAGTPPAVRQLADMSRVNVLSLVVNAVVQSMYVDGFRAARASEDVPAWDLWQRNRLDARQTGVHRARSTYGAAYVTVLPGEPVPVIRGASPRKMTVVYGEDDDWPLWALEKRRSAGDDGRRLWRLFDDEAAYWLSADDMGGTVEYVSHEEHGLGVVPVVRFLDTDDLDDEVVGEVEPLIPLQDQINITTFGLLVAQHYGAHKQRYILGWLAESEEEKLKAKASEVWTFEEHPDDIKVGEFAQTDLKGYIESREATIKHLAAVSQTTAHELLGQIINLSAEALAAAEASKHRKITERKMLSGESWEQSLALGGQIMGFEPDPSAQVVWQDTESRSLNQVADALGKLAKMLNVPEEALWERIPGVTQADVERWKAMRAEGDAFANLAALMEQQAAETPVGA